MAEIHQLTTSKQVIIVKGIQLRDEPEPEEKRADFLGGRLLEFGSCTGNMEWPSGLLTVTTG
jgi:hypothetical protein